MKKIKKNDGKVKGSVKRAVSEKAYSDFTSRLKMTLLAGCGDKEAYKEAVDILDSYVEDASVELDKENYSISAWIAFSMIRPEIDKAMRRSRMARERALRRRTEKSQLEPIAVSSSLTVESVDSHEPEVISEHIRPHLNRRERRQIKQDLVRELRRSERRRALMAKADSR